MARCILPVEVGVLFLLHPETAQIPVQIRLDPVARQRTTPALYPAPVEHDDRASGLGQSHKRLHVAAEAGQARHLRGPGAIHPDGEVVGKLGRAGAARAGIYERLVSHGVRSAGPSRQGMPRRNRRRGVFDLTPAARRQRQPPRSQRETRQRGSGNRWRMLSWLKKQRELIPQLGSRQVRTFKNGRLLGQT